MNSFLYVLEDEDLFSSSISDFCKNHKIQTIDCRIFSLSSFLKEGKKDKALSLGIEDIKAIQQAVFLKPIKSKNKVIVIQQAELLTIPAQNALLKLLEEPPDNTYIILTTTNSNILLPTIHSRCQIVKIKAHKKVTITKSSEAVDFAKITQLEIREALKHAEELAKDKEQTLNYLKNAILYFRESMISPNQRKYYLCSTVKKLQEAYTIIQTTNTNPRIVLEDLFLTLSQ
ncbi:MAG: hypothetical protein KatS3mg089_0684 [Patescibacteria group bacterium]|nr:MAG: hypothetical protein KatS3mg089_0684 [Patescibacteria group bacterium]